jgi:hypothetical protein
LIVAGKISSKDFYTGGKANMAKEQRSSLEKLSIDETLRQFDTDAERGPIEEGQRCPILDFLPHFWGLIPWISEIAAVLAAVLLLSGVNTLTYRILQKTVIGRGRP